MEIKLTKEQIQELDKFNFYIQAVTGGKEIYWCEYVYGGDFYTDLNGPYSPNNNDVDDNIEGAKIIEQIIYEYMGEYEYDIVDPLYCDDCTESGELTITYYTDTKQIWVEIDANKKIPNDYQSNYTFDQLIEMKPQYNWQKYEFLKMLQDEDFIKKCVNEVGQEVEVTYDGYGDDGQINEDIPDELQSLIYEILEIEYGGWENDMGSQGNVYINFKEKTLSVNHIHYSEGFETEFITEIQLK